MFEEVRVFHQPKTVKEAVGLLHKISGETLVVAGGTDLVLRTGRSVTTLVDISHVGLSYVKRGARGLRIGATTTLAEVEQSPIIRRLANGILAEAAACCGGLQNRNMATLGGNLANASPAADMAVPLLALDAEVVVRDLRRTTRVPLTRFFSSPHQPAASHSLLTEVFVPAARPRTAWAFQRLARTEVDIAIVNVAAGIGLDRQRRCVQARIALGAVAPQAMRALLAESCLLGQPITPELIERAAEAAAGEVRPITDIRASAEYRRAMSKVLVRRALGACAGRLGVSL
jgi:carbon-monoxide dehydrogenase medium subunit